MNADVAALTPRERGRIVKSVVSPRPIAWISTTGENGVDNLAPFSAYNYVSSANPVVLFSTPHGDDGDLKDTPQNVLDTGEFAVNVVTESLAAQMDRTSESIPPDESEFDLASVRRADCERIAPPRVADAVATMECTHYDSMRVHDRLLILGEAVHLHVDERIVTDGSVDAGKVDTVGRLGGPYYTGADHLPLEREY